MRCCPLGGMAFLTLSLTTPWNFTAPLSAMVAQQRRRTEVHLPTLAAPTPGGGAYLNEGDFNWQNVFVSWH